MAREPEAHASQRPLSLDETLKGLVGNAIRDMRVMLFRELAEHFLTLSRAHVIPDQGDVPTLLAVPLPRGEKSRGHERRKTLHRSSASSTKELPLVGKKLLPIAYRLFKQVFHNTCSICSFPTVRKAAMIESDTRPLKKYAAIYRMKEFIEFVNTHGAEAAKEEWRLLCGSCKAGRGADSWVGVRKARIYEERVFGNTCPTCRKDIHIPKRNKLLRGPGQPGYDRLRKFCKVFLTQGEAAAKASFSIICRQCWIKERGGVNSTEKLTQAG